MLASLGRERLSTFGAEVPPPRTYPSTDTGDVDGNEGARVLLHPEALAYLEDSNTFVEEINPGNQLAETIVFRYPQLSIQSGVWGFSEGVIVDIQFLQAAVVTVARWPLSVQPTCTPMVGWRGALGSPRQARSGSTVRPGRRQWQQ